MSKDFLKDKELMQRIGQKVVEEIRNSGYELSEEEAGEIAGGGGWGGGGGYNKF